MNPRICVSISPTDTNELLEGVQKAESLDADFSEIRLERLRTFDGLAGVGRAASKPLIATTRAIPEKPSSDSSLGDTLKLLARAVDGGFQFVDLDLKTPDIESAVKLLREKGAKIILSHHDYYRTPATSELVATLIRLWKHRPDICKLVTTANHLDDNLRILEFLKTNQSSPLVSFAMGKKGVWSRVLAPFYGSHFTYASLERGFETAPGQPPIRELRQIYKMLDVI